MQRLSYILPPGEPQKCPHGVRAQAVLEYSEFLQPFMLSNDTAIVGGIICCECKHFGGGRDKKELTILCGYPDIVNDMCK
jgi:hypothetical protein